MLRELKATLDNMSIPYHKWHEKSIILDTDTEVIIEQVDNELQVTIFDKNMICKSFHNVEDAILVIKKYYII